MKSCAECGSEKLLPASGRMRVGGDSYRMVPALRCDDCGRSYNEDDDELRARQNAVTMRPGRFRWTATGS